MSKYKGLFTFDVDNHRYLSIDQADGIITNMDYRPEPEPKKPLLEDDEARRMFRTWESYVGESTFKYDAEHDCLVGNYSDSPRMQLYFSFPRIKITRNLKDGEIYTIDELCGEDEE